MTSRCNTCHKRACKADQGTPAGYNNKLCLKYAPVSLNPLFLSKLEVRGLQDDCHGMFEEVALPLLP